MSTIANAAEWDACVDPAVMLTFLSNHLRKRRSEKNIPDLGFGRINRSDQILQRKLRLVASGFCRRLWHDLPDGEFRRAIETTELYADGKISAGKLVETRERLAAGALPFEQVTREKMHRALTNAMRTYEQEDVGRLLYVALSTAWEVGEIEAAPRAIWTAVEPQWNAYAIARNSVANSESQKLRANLLRDVIPNPFNEPKVKPEWMSWNSETIRRLAETIYAEHRFADMPILADALEEAGCDERPLLEHCRNPGPHIRGCWAVDLLRGDPSMGKRGRGKR